MSFWDLIEEVGEAAEKAKAVKEHAEDLADVALSGYEKLNAVSDLQKELSTEAKEGRKVSTLGFLYRVGRRIF
jgi:hypothetical protein